MPENNTLDILKSAILLEKKGQAFYGTVAKQTDTPSVKEFFAFMADEEAKHVELLSRQFKAYQENGSFLPNTPAGQPSDTVASSVLTKDLQERISAAGFEAAAVSAAMAMEQRAITLYSGRAASTTDADERALYNWLAEWERGHLHLLSAMDRELTEKIWHDNQFWPF